MTVIVEHTLLPSPQGGEAQLDSLLVALSAPGAVTLSGANESVEVPEALKELLRTIVASLREGSAVTVEPKRTRLTTQETADMLGVSRPTIVRLLESGAIPYSTPGRHRRVELADVLSYRQRIRTERADALEALSAPELAGKDVGFIETR